MIPCVEHYGTVHVDIACPTGTASTYGGRSTSMNASGRGGTAKRGRGRGSSSSTTTTKAKRGRSKKSSFAAADGR